MKKSLKLWGVVQDKKSFMEREPFFIDPCIMYVFLTRKEARKHAKKLDMKVIPIFITPDKK
jgi:CMP-N-acetylneuraminic acid synthetase